MLISLPRYFRLSRVTMGSYISRVVLFDLTRRAIRGSCKLYRTSLAICPNQEYLPPILHRDSGKLDAHISLLSLLQNQNLRDSHDSEEFGSMT